MMSRKIPSVLQQDHGNSLSTERLLKQAIELLEQAEWTDEKYNDDVFWCMDGLRDMVRAIDRSDG